MDLESFTTSNDKYDILAVAPDAPPEAIKLAYRRLAFLYHPDRHNEADKSFAEDIIKRVNSAYRILSDPEIRRRYDSWRRRSGGTQETFDDDGDDKVDFRGILDHLFEFEHAFSDLDLDRLDNQLRNLVRQNMLGDIREEIVGVIPIPNAPRGTEVQGSFKSGGLVLTTFRVLVPFLTQWQVQSGNVKTTYTRTYMFALAFVNITRVQISVHGQLRRRVVVTLHQANRQTEVLVREPNLSKLLLLCSLWGIPIAGHEVPERSRELRRVLLWQPLFWVVPIVGVYHWFFDTEGNGTWKILLLTLAAALGWGAGRAWKLINSRDLSQFLSGANQVSAGPQRAPDTLGASLAGNPGA